MSYTLFSADSRTARKPHRCIWCGQEIRVGTAYTDERSVYYGNIQRHRWHPECREAAAKYFLESLESGEEDFDPWDNKRPTTTQ